MSRWIEMLERAEMQARPELRSQAFEAVKRYYGLVDDGSAAHEPASMSDSPHSETVEQTPTDVEVQRHVDRVCDHLIAGRTTPAQRSGLSTAVERAGRVPSGSDAAVGRIARLVR